MMKPDHLAPFQKLPVAAEITGLSQHFLRRGCQDGTVPHVKSGRVYLVNIPALLHALGATAAGEGSCRE